MDIPLLFEKKLDKICDFTILFYAPLAIRKKRAMRRKGMQKKILKKITKSQLADKIKKKKADFIINTSKTKNHSFKMTLVAINNIMKKNA